VTYPGEPVDPTKLVGDGGWIVKELPARQFQPPVLKVLVKDASGRQVEQTAPIEVTPPKK